MEKNLAHRTNRDVECRSPLTTSSDFMLQWGKRKRLRCVKFQVKEHGTNNVSSGSKTVNPAAAGSDRRDARSGLICCTNNPNSQRFHNDRYGHNGGGSGPQNFRQQAASSSHKISRNKHMSMRFGHEHDLDPIGRLKFCHTNSPEISWPASI